MSSVKTKSKHKSLMIQQQQISILPKKMIGKWYLDFDQVFEEKTLTKIFSTNHNILNLFIKKQSQFISQKWPFTPHIPSLFLIFEKIESLIQKLHKLSPSIRTICNLLKIEKLYAKYFWKKERRVQASMVHLYIFIQKIYKEIFNASQGYCQFVKRNMRNFQKLNTKLLCIIQEANLFFLSQLFKEEKILTKNFLNNFQYFLNDYHWKSEKNIFHIPKLLNYIILNNQIQSNPNCEILQQSEEKRQKNLSIYTNSSSKSISLYKKATRFTDISFNSEKQIRFSCQKGKRLSKYQLPTCKESQRLDVQFIEIPDLSQRQKENNQQIWNEEFIKGKIDYKTGKTLDNWKKMKEVIIEKNSIQKISKIIHEKI